MQIIWVWTIILKWVLFVLYIYCTVILSEDDTIWENIYDTLYIII